MAESDSLYVGVSTPALLFGLLIIGILTALLLNTQLLYYLRRGSGRSSSNSFDPFPVMPIEQCTRKSRRHSLMGPGAFLELPFVNRRRKRKVDDDAISVQSLDMGTKKKTRLSLIRMSSLASIFSPVKSSKRRDSIESNASFKVPSSPATPRTCGTPYKTPKLKASKRITCTWSDMMVNGGTALLKALSSRDIKRQEAIYELYQGELDLLQDLNIIQRTYLESMRKLHLLTDGEIQQIFGDIEGLMPVHEDLVTRLLNQRLPDGTTHSVGETLLDWTPHLTPYIDYCANHVFAKALLDEKSNDPDVDDFLQRCIESPFSRKLDLWSLLDNCRGRFMKYPLLIKNIEKYTLKDHADTEALREAASFTQCIISEADRRTGEAKCRFYQAKITYIFDEQRHPLIEKSTTLVCSGCLKNNKGSKLHLFLFDRILVVSRLTTSQNGRGSSQYQVYRQPIPIQDLCVEDLQDGQVKMGSFRSAFGQGNTAKNVFRVSFINPTDGQAHTLLLNDEHDKRQWLQAFYSVLPAKRQPNPAPIPNRQP